MKDYHINIFYSEEDEGHIADIPDLKFCSAFGDTPEGRPKGPHTTQYCSRPYGNDRYRAKDPPG
jgi:hypothetical protein